MYLPVSECLDLWPGPRCPSKLFSHMLALLSFFFLKESLYKYSWFEKFVKDLKDEEKYFWKDRYFMDMGLYPKTHLPSSYHGC